VRPADIHPDIETVAELLSQFDDLEVLGDIGAIVLPANDPVASIGRVSMRGEVARSELEFDPNAPLLVADPLKCDAIRKARLYTLDVKLHAPTQVREKEGNAHLIVGGVP
jgi:hypothetical protein